MEHPRTISRRMEHNERMSEYKSQKARMSKWSECQNGQNARYKRRALNSQLCTDAMSRGETHGHLSQMRMLLFTNVDDKFPILLILLNLFVT